MIPAAFFGEEPQIERVYAGGRRQAVAERTDLYPDVVSLRNFDEHAPRLGDREAIFSTWGMPVLEAAQLDRLPRLRAVFYAAGSVQRFARPFLERNITVVSAWQANAVPVAEFTLAQILLANKGYFRNTLACRAYESRRRRPFVGRGNFGETVAILGAGAIGRILIALLAPFHVRLVVFDPFLSDEDAARLGVAKVSLEDAFAQGYVVTNHIANRPETVKLLRGELFARMRDDATFINTGRGATVDEEGMIRVLQARPSLTALLDVTHPEPPAPDSPLYTLPNVHLTSHIAGSVRDEVVRMADYCIAEFDAWARGEPLRFAVTPAMLDTMA